MARKLIVSTNYSGIISDLQAYANEVREDWVKAWPGQVVLAISQVYWTAKVHTAINAGSYGLQTLWNDLQVRKHVTSCYLW
jgi:hypothetical protein